MDTPQIKFEQSPVDSLAESFVSTPGSLYPLFPPSDTVIPSEALTPPLDDDDVLSRDRSESIFQEGLPREMAPDTPTTEKKPVKKRKSWGQQLPEPKTNLPPR
jgi:transcriptional activator HAC1